MAGRLEGAMRRIQEHAPNWTQVLGFVTLFISGAILLVLTGLSVLALVVLTPVLILLSPIWIPIGTALVVAVAALFCAGGFGVAAILAVSWLYSYVKGRHPPGSDHMQYARTRIAESASQVKNYAREYGGYLEGKIRDAARGA